MRHHHSILAVKWVVEPLVRLFGVIFTVSKSFVSDRFEDCASFRTLEVDGVRVGCRWQLGRWGFALYFEKRVGSRVLTKVAQYTEVGLAK